MSISKYTYFIFTLLVALWCFGIIAAPVLNETHSNISNLLYEFYSKVCHQKDSHSFHIGNEKFGVCIRCTSVYFGFFLGLLLIPLLNSCKKKFLLESRLLLIFMIPIFADVFLNLFNILPSTSQTRIISGLILGIAAPLFIFPLLTDAISKLLNENGDNNYV